MNIANMKLEIKEYENPKVKGIHVEGSDPEVGIMSSSYCLTLEDNGTEHQFWFDWDTFYNLVKEFKPYCDELNSEE